MRPSVKVFRYLAALTPLLGLALAGCGGLLGSVNGSGTGGTPAPTPAQFSLSGRAFVEKPVTTRQFQAGDLVLANATVNVLEVTAGGSVVGAAPTTVVRATGTTDANGNFSLTVPEPTGSNPNGLWLVQVTGTVGTPARTVTLLSAFVPGSRTVVSALDVDVATTLVAVRILPLATTPGSAQFLQAIANLPALISTTDFRIRNGQGNGNLVNLTDVAATTVNALVAQLSDEALAVVPTPHLQTIVHGQGGG